MFAPEGEASVRGGSVFWKGPGNPWSSSSEASRIPPYQDSTSLHAVGSSSQPRRLRQRLASPALPTERCLRLDSRQPVTSLCKADFPPSLPILERSAKAALALMSLLTAHPLFTYLSVSKVQEIVSLFPGTLTSSTPSPC